MMTMVLAAVQSGIFAMAGTKEAKLPDYSGKRYEAMVPDTLDLAHRAELAMHGIAGTTDTDNDYLMWFHIHWGSNPPYMKHSGAADMECTPKFYDAMTLLRQACGSRKYLDTERGMETALLSWLNKDDGLYDTVYSPKRPWHMEYYGVKTKKEDYASPVGSGIMLTALIARYDLGQPCEDQIRALVRGLDKAAIKKDDYAYYPEGGGSHSFSFLRSTNCWANTAEAKSDHEGSEGATTFYQAYQMRGLAMWAARSEDKQALELAGKLARYVMKPRFWGNAADPPHVVGNEQGHVDSHFHARMAALRGLLEYGIVAGDTRACDFVRSSYEYIRSYGINRIGFTPYLYDRNSPAMESCMLGDFLALTVKMSRAGIGDYWDDADRIIRNQMAESQITDINLLERLSQNAPKTAVPESQPGQISTENVHERMLGIFASITMPTCSISGVTMQCCTGNAARGIAYAWDGIIDGQGDEVSVNLLLNRASKWLDVDSYLPYEGKVVIRNKTASRVSVRIPLWVDRSKLKASVNGAGRKLSWVGAYVVFSDMKPGDKLQLDFPVKEETVHLTAKTNTDKKIAENKEHMTALSEADKESEQYTTYAITFRGNTVVDISPRNESPNVYPMYLRDHMKTGKKAPMKKIQRFAPDKTFRW